MHIHLIEIIADNWYLFTEIKSTLITWLYICCCFAFQLAKLFWDIGGTLGLWLGCSVFSIVEIIELALDAFVLFCCKRTKRQHKVQPCTSNSTELTHGYNISAFERTIGLDKHVTVRKKLVFSTKEPQETNCQRQSKQQKPNSNRDYNSKSGRHSGVNSYDDFYNRTSQDYDVFRYLFGNMSRDKKVRSVKDNVRA